MRKDNNNKWILVFANKTRGAHDYDAIRNLATPELDLSDNELDEILRYVRNRSTFFFKQLIVHRLTRRLTSI